MTRRDKYAALRAEDNEESPAGLRLRPTVGRSKNGSIKAVFGSHTAIMSDLWISCHPQGQSGRGRGRHAVPG